MLVRLRGRRHRRPAARNDQLILGDEQPKPSRAQPAEEVWADSRSVSDCFRECEFIVGPWSSPNGQRRTKENVGLSLPIEGRDFTSSIFGPAERWTAPDWPRVRITDASANNAGLLAWTRVRRGRTEAGGGCGGTRAGFDNSVTFGHRAQTVGRRLSQETGSETTIRFQDPNTRSTRGTAAGRWRVVSSAAIAIMGLGYSNPGRFSDVFRGWDSRIAAETPEQGSFV